MFHFIIFIKFLTNWPCSSPLWSNPYGQRHFPLLVMDERLFLALHDTNPAQEPVLSGSRHFSCHLPFAILFRDPTMPYNIVYLNLFTFSTFVYL